MKSNFTRAILCVFAMATSSAVVAQQNPPHSAYLYPAGGRQGTTFEATVGGQFLDGARAVFVSGKGVQATVTSVTSPLSTAQKEELTKELQQIRESHNGTPGKPIPAANVPSVAPAADNRTLSTGVTTSKERGTTPPLNFKSVAVVTPWTPVDRERVKEIQKKLDESTRMIMAPAFSRSVKLHVVVASDATSGSHELRLLTDRGMTNPIVFYVDHLPEYSQPPQYVSPSLSAGGGISLSEQAHSAAAVAPITVSFPIIVNGQMMPGSPDRYCFRARKGQHLVIEAKTRALIPYLSDAVPGWFQANLALYDPKGHELASADHFRFSQDPVIEQDIPEDGNYTVEIRDAIYRGREDFVYRITIGELPYVTSIFPLGGEEGSHPRLELSGWNLGSTNYRPSTRETGLHLLTVGASGWNANSVPFEVDSLPEKTQIQSVTDFKKAKRIKLPAIVNGRIAHPGDVHIFRIDAQSGEEIAAEVHARRLGSPLDSVLSLTDANGKQLAFNDDAEDKASALITHQADSLLLYRAVAKGTYFLHLTDAQHSGGLEYSYRLRLSHPRPDFELRLVPSTVNLRPGETIPVTVYALRHDGFHGEISLHVKDGPSGLVLHGGVISSSADKVRVTLTAPPVAISQPQNLLLEGEAQIDGRPVYRAAVPADDMMQAFAWHHLVPAQEGLVLVFGSGHRDSIWKVSDSSIKVHGGGTASIRVGVPASQLANQWDVKLIDAPEGISISGITKSDNAIEIHLKVDGKIKEGLKGNFIMEASIIKPQNPANPKANRVVSLGTLPAIPFEVVRP